MRFLFLSEYIVIILTLGMAELCSCFVPPRLSPHPTEVLGSAAGNVRKLQLGAETHGNFSAPFSEFRAGRQREEIWVWIEGEISQHPRTLASSYLSPNPKPYPKSNLNSNPIILTSTLTL